MEFNDIGNIRDLTVHGQRCIVMTAAADVASHVAGAEITAAAAIPRVGQCAGAA
jgi:NifU-like protein involved in Fe-S cluster formation